MSISTKVLPRTTPIEDMAPPKPNGRRLLTNAARPFFQHQLARLNAERRATQGKGRPYYENGLADYKADGAPQSANWIFSGLGLLLEGLDTTR